MTTASRFLIASALACFLITPPQTLAQWPPGDGMPVADRAGEQTQPKIHPTADGGCYISWFDNAGGGYDVYLQRLDAAGNEQWTSNGILIADRSFSSTEDYGLDVDDAGNALLAFRDDRDGNIRITVAKVAPDGTLAWGPNGVQVTTPTEDVLSPRIGATTGGGCVVGWTTIIPSGQAAVGLQKLDAAGNALWTTSVTLADSGDGNFMLSAIHTSDNDSVVFSWVRSGAEFWSPKHLWAQKIAADGTLLWDPNHVRVYDDGSLQFGYFPEFVPDGGGGAVFGWYYIVGNDLDCAAQHILADGSEAFAHNGAAVSTLASQLRVSPAVCYDPPTEYIYMFWTETDSNQNDRGTYGQKLDATGNRMWGDSGVVLVPLGDQDIWSVCTVPYADGAIALWLSSSAFNQDVVQAARLDRDGNQVWTPSPMNVTPTVSGKSRLTATLSVDGTTLAAWMDARAGDYDIYAQNIFGDGTMGTCPGDLDFNGVIDLSDLAQLLSNYGTTSGATYTDGDLDADGDVDLSDLAALLAVYGESCQ